MVLILGGCAAPLDEDALVERVESFDPTWESFQEEAKAYVGARPVAEWKGRPTAAALQGDILSVTFSIQGPWTHRAIAMPILLRGPDLPPRLAESATLDGSTTVYHFPLEATTVLPWVEVQFPRGTRRLTPTRIP